MSDMPALYCPGCQPDADPVAEVLILERCFRHPLDVTGADDAAVVDVLYAADRAAPEVVQRAVCAFVHRLREE